MNALAALRVPCAFPPEGAAAPGASRRLFRVVFRQGATDADLTAVGVLPDDATDAAIAALVPLCYCVEDFSLPVGRPVAGLSYAHLAEIERANRNLPLEPVVSAPNRRELADAALHGEGKKN